MQHRVRFPIDYIAGIGIFLLSVVFVFQFVSGLFIPFQSGSDKAALAADRASTILVEQMLHADTSGALNVINQSKLYNFNNTQLNYSKQENYTNYKKTITSLGLNNSKLFFDMNVSVAYLNGTIRNQSGPALPDYTDIAQTKRLVLIINSSTGYNQTAFLNQTAILSVRVW